MWNEIHHCFDLVTGLGSSNMLLYTSYYDVMKYYLTLTVTI